MRKPSTLAPRILLLALVSLFATEAFSQGVHITLRANPTPKAYDAYSDVVADGNYAYLATDRSYGVFIYDISNPDAPTLAARYGVSGSAKKMEGIQVKNGIGYFASDSGGGIHIVNLSDPTHPTLITRITSAAGGYDSVHDLTYDGAGHLFVPDYCRSSNVQVWNVNNPAAPFLQTTLTGTDGLCVHDVTVSNNRLYITGWSGTIDIVDIANLDSTGATTLGSFACGVHSQDISVTGDGHYLFCPREAHPPIQPGPGDVRVFDISNPASVTLVAELDAQSLGISASSPSTSKVMNNLLFVAWYQAGVMVFDITDPVHPMLIGNYDTWPGAVLNNGDGNWGVWPYLGLDRLVISDRTTGLYVLDASGVSSQPAVLSVGFNPASVLGSRNSTGTIHLVGIASGAGLTVNVTSNDPAAASSSVVVPAGATSSSFTQSTSPVAATTVATLTASDGSYSAAGNLTILPPQVTAVSFSPKSTFAGSVTGTVTMNAAVPTDTQVALTVLAGSAVVTSIPPSVTVPAGFSTAPWTVTVHSVSANTQVKVKAAANGTSKTAAFTVTADRPSAFSFSPTSVVGGGSSTGTITFPVPLSSDTPVTLTVVSGNGAVNSIPSTVTALNGTSSVQFTLTTNPVSASTTVQISASANGGAKTATLTVQ